MAQIIISYRPEDTRAAAGRLHDYLSDNLPGHTVKFGVDQLMQPGADIRTAVQEGVKKADALLLLIGSSWSGEWLNNASDPNVVAISTALVEQKRLFPVLIDGAALPEDLPETIAALSRRMAVRLDDNTFRQDASALVSALKQAFQSAATPPAPQAGTPYAPPSAPPFNQPPTAPPTAPPSAPPPYGMQQMPPAPYGQPPMQPPGYGPQPMYGAPPSPYGAHPGPQVAPPALPPTGVGLPPPPPRPNNLSEAEYYVATLEQRQYFLYNKLEAAKRNQIIGIVVLVVSIFLTPFLIGIIGIIGGIILIVNSNSEQKQIQYAQMQEVGMLNEGRHILAEFRAGTR